jgi:hypothetical protein
MHQQLWGYKVEEKIYVGGTRTKKVEYHCCRLKVHIGVSCDRKILAYTHDEYCDMPSPSMPVTVQLLLGAGFLTTLFWLTSSRIPAVSA